MSWQVRVDPRRCVGSGMCLGVAPERFVFEGGRSRALADQVGGAADDVVAAATCCPMEAITVTDLVTGDVLFGPRDG